MSSTPKPGFTLIELFKGRNRDGFSLITVSIILTVAALALTSVLPGKDAGNVGAKSMNSILKLQKVEEAMTGFMAANGRRPCPADGQYAVGNANFGLEASSPNSGLANNPAPPCTGGTIAAPLGPDAISGYVVGGTIPTKTLGLSDDYAFDEWGRAFTYVVDGRAAYVKPYLAFPPSTTPPTAFATCDGISRLISRNGFESTNAPGTSTTPPPTPGVFIKSTTATGGKIIDQVMYAYISHGPGGDGAWTSQGNAARLNTGNTDPDTLNNAFYDASGNPAFTNVLVKKESDATFQDIVYYADALKTTCCIGGVCSPVGFRAINTANSISSLATGDVNGDGIPDLIIGVQGAPGDCTGGWACGYIYVLFGTSRGFPDPVDLSQLNGQNGFVIEQDELGPGIWAGTNVAAGDINGDGISDIIFTEPGTGGAPDVGYGATYSLLGSTFVVFGQKCGGSWPTACSAVYHNNVMDDGIQGMRYDNTVVQHSNLPVWPNVMSLAVGDVNGDGVQDLIIGDIGAAWYQPSGWMGQAHVIFGKKCGGLWPTRCSTPVSLVAGSAPLDGVNGFELTSGVADDQFPTAMAIGNVSGHADGAQDLVVSANAYYGWPGGVAQAGGAVYVVYGQKNGTWPAHVTLSSSLDGTTASQFWNGQSAGQMDGSSIAVGDVNGDGRADIAFTSPYAWTYDSAGEFTSGVVHVIYGPGGKFPGNSDLWSWGNGTNGYVISQPTYNGWGGLRNTQLAIGDVNGDRKGDIIFGNTYTSTLSRSSNGVEWVLYGKSGTSMPASAYLGGSPQGTNPLLDGVQGFELEGPASNCNGGYASVVADLNNDGIGDIIEADGCGVDVIYGKKPGK